MPSRIILKALETLYANLAKGQEWPDAHTNAIARHKLTVRQGEALTKAYDESDPVTYDSVTA